MSRTETATILLAPPTIRLNEDILSVLEQYRIVRKVWLDAPDDAPNMTELERVFHCAAVELASWVDAEINFQQELAGRK